MQKISIVIFLFLMGCAGKKNKQPIIVKDSLPSNVPITGRIFATAYQQTAGEYRALCFQAFNIARIRVNEFAKSRSKKEKSPVIITDIDETILDNSPVQAHQAYLGKGYDSLSWKQWSDRAEADTVPGAAAFLKYAASKGIEIFYVTNRRENEGEATIANLKKYNFPNADPAHLLAKVHKDSTSKETRRQSISNIHHIVMLLGDNLGDFSSLFDKKMLDERRENVNKAVDEFGSRFIVLPNPGYGDWESAIYQYKKWKPAQKDSMIKTVIKSY
jgi:5'-nucleotidase (lipoprotein e(P4) family)